MPETIILGFDTSAAHCAAALLCDGQIMAARQENMAKGQAERLMPLLAEVLAEAGMAWRDLTGIGVGTGPGNFTGIRISVSAARGLALGLGIPAHGVSLLEALSYGTEGPVLASLDARREQVYLQRHGRGTVVDIVPCLADPAALPPGLAAPGLTCIGHRAELIAEQLGAHAAHAALASAPAIARIAATRPAKPTERPAPLYIRTPDAALPREPAPVILL